MKAIVIHEYGPPDVLRYQDWPDPEPRAGEIRIKVHAATVNRVLDVSLRAGREMARGIDRACRDFRFVPTADIAAFTYFLTQSRMKRRRLKPVNFSSFA